MFWRNKQYFEPTIVANAGILEQSMGDKNRGVVVPAHQATLAGGIHSLETIPGLLKRLQIRTLD